MRKNYYVKESNILNYLLLVLIFLFIIYILVNIMELNELNIDFVRKLNGETLNLENVTRNNQMTKQNIRNTMNNIVIDLAYNQMLKINTDINSCEVLKEEVINKFILGKLVYETNEKDKENSNLNINVKGNDESENTNVENFQDKSESTESNEKNNNIHSAISNEERLVKNGEVNEDEQINFESLKEEKLKLKAAFNSNDDSKLLAINNLFTFESNIRNARENYDYEKILNNTSNKVDLKNKKILIFHTHSQETYKDSKDSKTDGIVGMGEELAKILREKYNLNVIHYTGEHDLVDGTLNREGSYERIEESILEILKEDNQIDVLIDLHRDGVPENTRLVTEIDGKKCAQLMLVNGICKINENGKLNDISYLPNDYVEDNLNLSMNIQMAVNKLYPTLSRKILVKPYRYSLHMKPNSILVELGAQNNTVEEVKNTLPYLAEIIYTGLKNKNEKI